MKLTIKRKLISAFLLVIFIFGTASFFSYMDMKKNNESYNFLLNVASELRSITQSLHTEVVNEVSSYRAYMLNDGNDMFKDQFIESAAKIDEFVKKGKELALLPETTDRLETIETLNTELVNTAVPIMDQFKTNREEASNRGIQEMTSLNANINSEVESLYVMIEEVTKERERETQEYASSAAKVFLMINIAAVIIALGLAVFLSHMISKPIHLVVERMKFVANGDLTREPLKIKTKDEIGQLVTATNEMAASMRNIVGKISGVSETVSSHSEELTQSAAEVTAGAEQMATVMEELASGAETQANRSGDLSSAMTEFVAKVQEANESGESVQEGSTKVLEMTHVGSQLMLDSTKQMKTINEIVKDSVENVQSLNDRSRKISQLVTVIKDIADQTNLLALNAAIEAARAGEHGRGFSVVAEEVRKLAEQTAVSVTEITGIVENIQEGFGVVTESLQTSYKEVEKGTNQIETTGETFNDISEQLIEMVNSFRVISENLSDIASTSQEMGGSVQEMAETAEEAAAGVEQASASVQQTNCSMEEVAGSSKQLAQLAEELNGLVRQFKL